MIRIEIIRHKRPLPDWALRVIACMPIPLSNEDSGKEGTMNAIRSYLRDFTYKRRNNWESLRVLHDIVEDENGFKISTAAGKPCLTIKLIKE